MTCCLAPRFKTRMASNGRARSGSGSGSARAVIYNGQRELETLLSKGRHCSSSTRAMETWGKEARSIVSSLMDDKPKGFEEELRQAGVQLLSRCDLLTSSLELYQLARIFLSQTNPMCEDFAGRVQENAQEIWEHGNDGVDLLCAACKASCNVDSVSALWLMVSPRVLTKARVNLLGDCLEKTASSDMGQKIVERLAGSLIYEKTLGERNPPLTNAVVQRDSVKNAILERFPWMQQQLTDAARCDGPWRARTMNVRDFGPVAELRELFVTLDDATRWCLYGMGYRENNFDQEQELHDGAAFAPHSGATIMICKHPISEITAVLPSSMTTTAQWPCCQESNIVTCEDQKLCLPVDLTQEYDLQENEDGTRTPDERCFRGVQLPLPPLLAHFFCSLQALEHAQWQ